MGLGAVTASLAIGNPKGVMAIEIEKEGTFQFIVLEGTSYEVGRMQEEIIKEAKNKA